MSSSSLTTCAFCTFINAPDSKICVICKKSLCMPPVATDPIDSQIKVCPACSYFNGLSDNVCQMCETSLGNSIPSEQDINAIIELPAVSSSGNSEVRICSDCSYSNDSKQIDCQMCGSSLTNIPMSEQDTDAGPSSNVCSMCGKSLHAKIHQASSKEIKICSCCTYHNTAHAVKCSICHTKFESQKEVLSKICPWCYHNNTPGMACDHCTFINSMGALFCVMCDEPMPFPFNDSMEMDVEEEEEDLTDNEYDDMEDDSVENDGYEEDIADDESTSTMAPTPTDDVNIPKYEVSADSFEILESAPQTHKYFHVKTQPHTGKFLRAVTTNIEILKTSVPGGVWIKAYEDRMDLLTFMIEGPNGTPYENGLFLFDIYLPHNFPSRPPKAHYISFWNHRLNPNLYTEGKVCVSLLGTWMAQRKEEKWGPKSTLLQLIVSIQGLILVEEPYFNEPGYSRQKGTAAGNQLSANYNEKVTEGMIKSTTELIANPPLVFKKEIVLHFTKCGQKMYQRLQASVILIRNVSPKILENFRLAIENICKVNETKRN